MQVKFTIEGEPTGKGRPKFNGNTNVAYTPKKTKDYENLVKWSYAEQVGLCNTFGDSPVAVDIVAYCSIPKRTTKEKFEGMIVNKLKPTKKPDVDNIAKIILDALNHIAYDDDKYVVSLSVKKVYSSYPKVMVSIRDAE